MSGYLDYLMGRENNQKIKQITKTNYDRFQELKHRKTAQKAVGGTSIIRPKSFKDIENLIDVLKQKRGVVVDLASQDTVLTQRMLDFLSGAIYALGGNIHRIEKRIYVMTPKGVKLMTNEEGYNERNGKVQKTV